MQQLAAEHEIFECAITVSIANQLPEAEMACREVLGAEPRQTPIRALGYEA